MKRIILFLIVYAFYIVEVSARNNLSGRYYAESGVYIEIKDKNFKLIMPNNAINGWNSEIMAEGTINKIGDSFLELNTNKNPIIEALKNLNITQTQESISIPNDSIKVKFLIPYQRGKLKILVFTNTSKIFSLNYSMTVNEINIPKDTKSISFYISPDFIKAHTTDGIFYGIVGLDSMQEYQIQKNINFIKIEIPDITNSFFETYYIRGDYARMTKDGIIWKGIIYRKCLANLELDSFLQQPYV